MALADEAATERLGAALAPRLLPGDTIALSGGLGAGKSTLARALIRTLADDPGLEVPSPTFTLVQRYAETAIPVRHFDLYRIAGAAELVELGFDEERDTDIMLVEWPERAGAMIAKDALTIELKIAGASRVALLSGTGEWGRRLKGMLAPAPPAPGR